MPSSAWKKKTKQEQPNVALLVDTALAAEIAGRSTSKGAKAQHRNASHPSTTYETRSLPIANIGHTKHVVEKNPRISLQLIFRAFPTQWSRKKLPLPRSDVKALNDVSHQHGFATIQKIPFKIFDQSGNSVEEIPFCLLLLKTCLLYTSPSPRD